ncbi:MAG: orotidine-5'-phosphate decarboxylase [Pseudomonadota bacterium]
MRPFADRFIEKTRDLGPLCVGIDPHPGRIPKQFGGDTPEGITRWGHALLEAIEGTAGIVKPQIALFERHGWQGLKAFSELCFAAHAKGFLVLADAKRGDIGSTAEGYARAYLTAESPFKCDALTANPYMGLDTLQPLVDAAQASGKGVIVLARTSNPGARDFQNLDVDGVPFYLRVVDALNKLSGPLVGQSGWSGLMLVVGATAPEEAALVRKRAPRPLFLVPGYGAQGAGVESALAGFVGGEGGCVSASRSINFPKAAEAATTEADWQAAVRVAARGAQAELSGAASRAA